LYKGTCSLLLDTEAQWLLSTINSQDDLWCLSYDTKSTNTKRKELINGTFSKLKTFVHSRILPRKWKENLQK
jgi:hypothetical protein